MRTFETRVTFPLSSVKPLEPLLDYRAVCLRETKKSLGSVVRRRVRSPIGGALLEPFGEVEGLAYGRCPESGSLFLTTLPERRKWADLLISLSRHRHSPEAFHSSMAQSRSDFVYAPKLEWIREALGLAGLRRPRILYVATPPDRFRQLLEESGLFSEIQVEDEMELTAEPPKSAEEPVEAALLLESLDRVDDPAALLNGTAARLAEGGLLFVTGLVSSGFDMAVLGINNVYLYPPDRANCFSLQGLSTLLSKSGFTLLEVSTPGVLDVEIVQAHQQHNPSLSFSAFERQILESSAEAKNAFQAFLQQWALSSFARIVARKSS